MNSHFNRLTPSKRRTVLTRAMSKTVGKFGLLDENDHVLVAVSGGIDSMTMLDLISEKSHWWARYVRFTPVHVFAGFPHEEEKLNNLIDFAGKFDMEMKIIQRPEISRIALGEDKPQNPCFICSRMRRKALVETAEELDANKIALGHHLEDVIQTFLINIFWGREISTMMPNQSIFKGRFHLIRPMYLIEEKRIQKYAKALNIQDQSAECPMEGETKRDYIAKLLDNMERDNPGIKSNIFRAMFHPRTDYLLEEYLEGKNDSTEDSDSPGK